MTKKWVDNDQYIGGDRRERGNRLLSRRRRDETTEPPPLHAILRRVRVALNDTGDTAHDRTLQLFAAALKMADELEKPKCVAALRRAEQAFRESDLDDAATLLAEATGYAE